MMVSFGRLQQTERIYEREEYLVHEIRVHAMASLKCLGHSWIVLFEDRPCFARKFVGIAKKSVAE